MQRDMQPSARLGANKTVEDLEDQLGIEPMDRWTMDRCEYVQMLEYSQQRQFIRAVEELENLVVQRLFELSKANLASTGKVVSYTVQ